MQLNALDWTVVTVSLLLAFSPALLFIRRAGRGAREFFASGQAAPWWLIGTSMVATTFSTDTPNLVTNLVRTGGVAANWSWWAFLLTGMLTVFLYARMWRRSGVLTDLEFYELRYSGAPAAAVRGFRALYLGAFFNCVIMASVTLAAVKIANVMLGWPTWLTLAVCGGISVAFALTSGLWGVMVADLVQFAIAMIGVFAAAWYALDHPAVGGLSGLVQATPPDTLRLLPNFSKWDTAVAIFVLPLAVQWWATWYPGAEPGGGSYVAQRMLAARDERHALGATLWFNIAHYALRPWPWIIVALCSLLVFPRLEDIHAALPHIDETLLKHDIAYPAMLTLLPNGLRGLLLASLLAAYVSTMSTHLNWGASYLVHDFYRRFAHPRDSEPHYVLVARVFSILLMALAAALVPLLESAEQVFKLMLQIGAGTGAIYLLRWYWWRINAWSEITGMVVSFVLAGAGLWLQRSLAAGGGAGALEPLLTSLGVLRAADAQLALVDSAWLVLTTAITTVAWIAVTLITPPASPATLAAFYQRVRPAGPGWNRVRSQIAAVPGASPDSLPRGLLGWACGCALVYAALFGVGNALYGRWPGAAVCAAVFLVSCAALFQIVRRTNRAPAPRAEVPG